MREVAGEPEELELERERERVERGPLGRAARQLVEQVEEPRQRLERARVPLLLVEQAQHRLGTDEPDAEPVRVLTGACMRADEIDAGDRAQLARALVQLQLDVRERLQPRAEPALRLAHALRDGAHPPSLERVEVQHPIGLAETDRPQHDCLRADGATGHGSTVDTAPARAGPPATATIADMPELPEVEIVRRVLSPLVQGRLLAEVRIDDVRLVAPEAPADIAIELTGTRVERLERRGKYLAWSLDSGALLATHLRMTGMFRLPEEGLPERTRALLRLDDGRLIAYTDTRRFGTWELLRTREEQDDFFTARLGPEPLGESFTAGWLRTVLRRRHGPLKAAILDQRVCAGMGNIYASEALFRARLHPLRPANSLSKAEAERLVTGVRTALAEGIRFGGSSIRDYTSPDGALGEAQDEHLVYGREGEPCPSCGRELSRLVIAGRTTVFCSSCQRPAHRATRSRP